MRKIRNISNQSLTIPFQTPEGGKSIFLTKGNSIEVLDSWASKIANNLRSRRMVQIINIGPDPAPKATAPVKRNQKWFDENK